MPPDRFRQTAGTEDLVLSQFNTKISNHRFCRHCGIHTFDNPRSAPDMVSINVNCLDDFDPDTGTFAVDVFDGRNWEDAFAARQGKI